MGTEVVDDPTGVGGEADGDADRRFSVGAQGIGQVAARCRSSLRQRSKNRLRSKEDRVVDGLDDVLAGSERLRCRALGRAAEQQSLDRADIGLGIDGHNHEPGVLGEVAQAEDVIDIVEAGAADRLKALLDGVQPLASNLKLIGSQPVDVVFRVRSIAMLKRGVQPLPQRWGIDLVQIDVRDERRLLIHIRRCGLHQAIALGFILAAGKRCKQQQCGGSDVRVTSLHGLLLGAGYSSIVTS